MDWSDGHGGITSIEIAADGTWTPSIRIHAPMSAMVQMQDICLLASHDEDQNVSVGGILPVEANRTVDYQ